TVTQGALPFALTIPITVTVKSTRLVVTSPPATSVAAGSGFGLVVQAQDALGNLDTSFNGPVTIALTNPAGAALSGTTTVNAVNGVATCSGRFLNNLAPGYTLVATSSGLTAATTAAFNVVSASATQLVVTTQPPFVPAAATAILSNGTVTAINLVSPGSDYT